MTMRSTTQWAARQAQTSIARATVREMDDNHLCQECKFADVGFSETPSQFEVWHPLGVTSVAMRQKEDQQQQQPPMGSAGPSGGGQGSPSDPGGVEGPSCHRYNRSQPKGEAAELVMVYANGHRAHPIGMPNDRRVRPYDMDPGEAALYSVDGSGQIVYHRVRGDDKDGLYILTLDDQGGGTRADGTRQQQQKRFISIRHANKPKQSRKPQKRQQGGAMPQAGQQQQRYKHEGDSVNTEQRLTAQQIQFYDGGTNVGHYDRGGKDWLHHDGSGASHSTRADKSHSHIKHGGSHIWVDDGCCWSSKPIQIQSDDCS